MRTIEIHLKISLTFNKSKPWLKTKCLDHKVVDFILGILNEEGKLTVEPEEVEYRPDCWKNDLQKDRGVVQSMPLKGRSEAQQSTTPKPISMGVALAAFSAAA